MGSMKGKQEKIDAAFGRLADMIQSGHLLASADPVGFLDTVVAPCKFLNFGAVSSRQSLGAAIATHLQKKPMARLCQWTSPIRTTKPTLMPLVRPKQRSLASHQVGRNLTALILVK